MPTWSGGSTSPPNGLSSVLRLSLSAAAALAALVYAHPEFFAGVRRGTVSLALAVNPIP